MPRVSTITPQKIATIREGHAAGMSSREIGKLVDLSHVTVQKLIAKDVARGGAPAERPKRETAPSSDAATAAALLAAPLPAPGDPEALSEVRARAALVRGLLDRLTGPVEREEFPATNWVTLARYGDELARLIAELTPPAPKDPNEDPDVLEAEKILIARIDGMVKDAEAKRQ